MCDDPSFFFVISMVLLAANYLAGWLFAFASCAEGYIRDRRDVVMFFSNLFFGIAPLFLWLIYNAVSAVDFKSAWKNK